ncbi:MAG: ABC transporter ATP-binding protein [Candidatus Schekmanbacteria bacterium]|nr:ABC transporter ATP-binding protein [Candidatus Schekmanbacteria bacterium]
MSGVHGGEGGSILEEHELGKAYDSNLMKRLWVYVAPHKWLIIISLCILPVVAVLQLLQPYIIKTAIDNNIARGELKGLNVLAVLFFSILILQYIVTFIQQYLLQIAGQKIILDLRTVLFTHVQRLPLKFFDKNPVGRLVTRLTGDVENLNEMFTAGIASFAGDFIMLAGIMVAMLMLNMRLAFVMFTVLPFLAVLAAFFRVKGRKAYRVIRTKTALVNSYLEENLSGIEIVKLFRREKRNFEEFQNYNNELRKGNMQSVIYDALLYAFVELIGSVSVALIIWYGGGEILRNAISFGVLVAFIEYVQKFFVPIRDLSQKYAIMQQAMASSERVLSLLDEEEEKTDESVGVVEGLKGEIEFRNVTFAYNGGDPVIRDFSLNISPGEKVAIVGATGAGKSTLLKLLLRFYECEQGNVYVDGVDIREIKKDWLRRNIGIVPQDIFLFSGDIEGNLRLANDDITTERLQECVRTVKADRVIEKLPAKLKEHVSERGNNFSSGEKQLLSFARVLAFNPKILILDEATSNVDVETEHLIQQGLKELLRGRTSIIIAHRLSTIRDADRIAVMHKGKLRELGTHEELLIKKGIYYRLYRLQGGVADSQVAEGA